MTIYDFLETVCSPEAMEFSIFNLNTEEVINVDYDNLMYSDYVNCEIGSFDIWNNERTHYIHIEFNIEIEED